MARYIKIQKIDDCNEIVIYAFCNSDHSIKGSIIYDKINKKTMEVDLHSDDDVCANTVDSIRIRVEWKILKACEKDAQNLPDVLDWLS